MEGLDLLPGDRREQVPLEGGRGDTHLVPTHATDDPATVGPVDLVLFCVKLWDVESAGEKIKPLVGPRTAVIPLQNGIDASERLTPIGLGHDTGCGGERPGQCRRQPGAERAVVTVWRV